LINITGVSIILVAIYHCCWYLRFSITDIITYHCEIALWLMPFTEQVVASLCSVQINREPFLLDNSCKTKQIHRNLNTIHLIQKAVISVMPLPDMLKNSTMLWTIAQGLVTYAARRTMACSHRTRLYYGIPFFR